MKILGVIPARYASSRFPGKPLALISGISMVERVYRQALKAASLSTVVVATDDERIAGTVRAFGGICVMTQPDHPSGTDRCAEALQRMEGSYEAVINIQGDEPFIHPSAINLLADALQEERVEIATLVKPVADHHELENPNTPKVVIASNGDALYFSRQPIPFYKGVNFPEWQQQHTYFKHIGIYGYRADVLPLLTCLPQGLLEKAESLEQLRWLEHGFRIRTRVTDAETVAVDTPDDLQAAEAFLRRIS